MTSLSLVLGNAGIVDIFRGSGFVPAGGSSLLGPPGDPTQRGRLFFGLAILCAARPALHIGIRYADAPEDVRYRKFI